MGEQSNAVCWYLISDLDNKEVPGIWYYYQLKLVARNDYNIEGNIEKYTPETQ